MIDLEDKRDSQILNSYFFFLKDYNQMFDKIEPTVKGILMKKNDLKNIETKIREDIEKLKQQIEILKEKTKPVAPDCSLGRLTREEALNEQMMNKKVLNEATLTLTRLNNALKRVNHEMFGVCVVCEEEINVERMLIRPESVRCVDCAN